MDILQFILLFSSKWTTYNLFFYYWGS